MLINDFVQRKKVVKLPDDNAANYAHLQTMRKELPRFQSDQ